MNTSECECQARHSVDIEMEHDTGGAECLSMAFVRMPSEGYALDVDFESMVAVSSANEYRFMLWDLRERKLLQSYESPGHNVNCSLASMPGPEGQKASRELSF